MVVLPSPVLPPSSEHGWRPPKQKQVNARTLQAAARCGDDIAALHGNIGAHFGKSRQVQVHGRVPMAQPPGSETSAFARAPAMGPAPETGAHFRHQLISEHCLDHGRSATLRRGRCQILRLPPNSRNTLPACVSARRVPRKETGCSVRRPATMSGKTAFFDPEIASVPCSGVPFNENAIHISYCLVHRLSVVPDDLRRRKLARNASASFFLRLAGLLAVEGLTNFHTICLPPFMDTVKPQGRVRILFSRLICRVAKRRPAAASPDAKICLARRIWSI